MQINEIKKELLKSKAMANFSHYISGNMYYTFNIESGQYQFPIPVVDIRQTFGENGNEISQVELSSDLGTTQFDKEIKASFLNRWIEKALAKDELIKL